MVTLTKFHEYRTKIVDFLLIETFLASPDNCVPPSTLSLLGNLTSKELQLKVTLKGGKQPQA